LEGPCPIPRCGGSARPRNSHGGRLSLQKAPGHRYRGKTEAWGPSNIGPRAVEGPRPVPPKVWKKKHFSFNNPIADRASRGGMDSCFFGPVPGQILRFSFLLLRPLPEFIGPWARRGKNFLLGFWASTQSANPDPQEMGWAKFKLQRESMRGQGKNRPPPLSDSRDRGNPGFFLPEALSSGKELRSNGAIPPDPTRGPFGPNVFPPWAKKRIFAERPSIGFSDSRDRELPLDPLFCLFWFRRKAGQSLRSHITWLVRNQEK